MNMNAFCGSWRSTTGKDLQKRVPVTTEKCYWGRSVISDVSLNLVTKSFDKDAR
jgi:hypothetical protein